MLSCICMIQRKNVSVILLAISLLLMNTLTAQSSDKDVIITYLDFLMKPVQSKKKAYAIEECKKEGAVWKAKVTTIDNAFLLAEYSYSDNSRSTLHGVYTRYHYNRKKMSTVTYVNGEVNGLFQSWTAEGKPFLKCSMKGELMFDQIEMYNADGLLKARFDTDENGNGTGKEILLQTRIAGEGLVKAGKQDGIWVYKDSTGKKIMEVVYDEKGIAKETCFDNDGNAITTGTCISDKPAEFYSGPDALKIYLEKSLKYPKQALYDKIQGIVQVKFNIDAAGNVSKAKVISSPDPLLSEEALRVINASGNWTPAVEANRKVTFTHIQSIAFRLE